MTSFMDRLAYAGGKYLAYKPAAICASARRAGTTTTLDQLVKYPEFFHMPLVSGSYWPMVHGSKPEQVLEDEEGCAVMRELGRTHGLAAPVHRTGQSKRHHPPREPPPPHDQFHPLSFSARSRLPGGGFFDFNSFFLQKRKKIRGSAFFVHNFVVA